MKTLGAIVLAVGLIGGAARADHAPVPAPQSGRATETPAPAPDASSFECTAICGVEFAGEYLTTLRSKVESAKGASAKIAFEALEKKCDGVLKGYIPVHIDGNRFLPGDNAKAATLKNSCARVSGQSTTAKKHKCTAVCGVYFAGKYFGSVKSKVESASAPNAGGAFKALEKKCDALVKGYVPVHYDGNKFLLGDDGVGATVENSCEEE